MKILQIICLLAVLSFAIGCKKEATEPSIEQQEQGTLPDSPSDTVPPMPTDTIAGDTVKPA